MIHRNQSRHVYRWYREETLPVVEYYRARHDTHVIDIDGTESIDVVDEGNPVTHVFKS